jgi:hypothetical protein
MGLKIIPQKMLMYTSAGCKNASCIRSRREEFFRVGQGHRPILQMMMLIYGGDGDDNVNSHYDEDSSKCGMLVCSKQCIK